MKNILIVGAGTGGLTVAARLVNASRDLSITIIDPADKHFYQPLWTLVGAGVFPHSASEKSMKEVIPEGVQWMKDSVTEFFPQENKIQLQSGTTLSYDALIVAPGIELNWEKIKGSKVALQYPNVCSNYLPYGSEKTWKVLQDFKEGNAIFTQPPLPIKCAGAPQKAIYLADDYFRNSGKREKAHLIFANNGPRIFGVEKYKVALEKVVKRKGIETKFEHNLIEIRPEENKAIFSKPSGELVEINYSMLHVVPPMSAPEFIKKSPLAGEGGWVEVDKFTLQHIRYPNVFSLGDSSSLPTSKTGAAIRKEAPVLVGNLLSFLAGKPLELKYNGYTSCPLVTGYGKVIMAEFDYDGHPMETFPIDQSKERWSMWFVKAHLLPVIYWKGMLKGRM
jgi:sulfide:quinone oxidoreductase